MEWVNPMVPHVRYSSGSHFGYPLGGEQKPRSPSRFASMCGPIVSETGLVMRGFVLYHGF
jgi:hypothetical protein